MERTFLNQTEQEKAQVLQDYYAALRTMLSAYGSVMNRTFATEDGFDDARWAHDLIRSMSYSEGWWDRILAKAAFWHIQRNPLHLQRLCLMDDIIWLLSEEVNYRRKANEYVRSEFTHASDDATASRNKLKASVASQSANRIENAKMELISKLYGGHPSSEAVMFLRSDAAMYSKMRANIAVTARERSLELCPRSETKDVLRIRQFLDRVTQDFAKDV